MKPPHPYALEFLAGMLSFAGLIILFTLAILVF